MNGMNRKLISLQKEIERIGIIEQAQETLERYGGPPTKKTLQEALERSRREHSEWSESVQTLRVSNVKDHKFRTRWNFVVSLCSKAEVAENMIYHLEENYKRDIERYGIAKARILYRKEVLRSLGPLLNWVLHRTIVIGIIKRFFPTLYSVMRQFR